MFCWENTRSQLAVWRGKVSAICASFNKHKPMGKCIDIYIFCPWGSEVLVSLTVACLGFKWRFYHSILNSFLQFHWRLPKTPTTGYDEITNYEIMRSCTLRYNCLAHRLAQSTIYALHHYLAICLYGAWRGPFPGPVASLLSPSTATISLSFASWNSCWSQLWDYEDGSKFIVPRDSNYYFTRCVHLQSHLKYQIKYLYIACNVCI